MHILLIHQAFTPLDEPGGTRHYELARFLVDNGHRVTVIASPVSYLTGQKIDHRHSKADHMVPKGLSIRRALVYQVLHRSFLHRVLNFLSFMLSSLLMGIRIRQVDLVWGTSPPIFQAVSAWALARLKGVPFLLEVRDLWPDFAVSVGVLHNPLLIRMSRWLEKFLYRQADRVIVNSPGFIEHVKAKGAGEVSLIPNGADPRMFDPYDTGQNFRRTYNLQGKYVVLYAGAHGMSNDLGVVLEAAQRLKDQKDIVIVLLGDGKEKSRLVEQAKHLQLDNLLFLPPIAKLEMPQALAAADACIAILKSIPLFATVYPNKVFDYMAAGRPVLLAIQGVTREVIETVQAGIPVEPGNPISLAEAVGWLVDHPEQGRQMGINGRAYVEQNLDRRVLSRRLEQILQKMVH